MLDSLKPGRALRKHLAIQKAIGRVGIRLTSTHMEWLDKKSSIGELWETSRVEFLGAYKRLTWIALEKRRPALYSENRWGCQH